MDIWHEPAAEFAWYSTIFCMFLTTWVARRYLEDNSRLYTAIALFAFAWVLVSAAYAVPGETRTPSEWQLVSLCGDVAAVLLVYVGGLLTIEARTQHAGHRLPVSWELIIPLWLAFLVAVPRAFTIPGAIGHWLRDAFHFGEFTAFQVEKIIGELLVAVGFISIAKGVKELRGWTTLSLLVVAVLVYYEGISFSRAYLTWQGAQAMSTFYLISFSAAKLALTILVCMAVVRYWIRVPGSIAGAPRAPL
jgi:hypothetical protein